MTDDAERSSQIVSKTPRQEALALLPTEVASVLEEPAPRADNVAEHLLESTVKKLKLGAVVPWVIFGGAIAVILTTSGTDKLAALFAVGFVGVLVSLVVTGYNLSNLNKLRSLMSDGHLLVGAIESGRSMRLAGGSVQVVYVSFLTSEGRRYRSSFSGDPPTFLKQRSPMVPLLIDQPSEPNFAAFLAPGDAVDQPEPTVEGTPRRAYIEPVGGGLVDLLYTSKDLVDATVGRAKPQTN